MKERTFSLIRDYHDIGRYLYTKTSVTFRAGLTVLVGCNGCGKTTMLTQVCDQLRGNGIDFYLFDNVRDGGSRARELAGYMGDMSFVGASLCSSEGENIMLNLCNVAKEIARYVNNAKKKSQQELWILLDAVDSGFSVDNVVELKELLFDTVFENQKDRDIYFLVTANEYEMARGEQCMDVPHCAYRTFSDYEDYRKYILQTRKRKDGKAAKNRGTLCRKKKGGDVDDR